MIVSSLPTPLQGQVDEESSGRRIAVLRNSDHPALADMKNEIRIFGALGPPLPLSLLFPSLSLSLSLSTSLSLSDRSFFLLHTHLQAARGQQREEGGIAPPPCPDYPGPATAAQTPGRRTQNSTHDVPVVSHLKSP